MSLLVTWHDDNPSTVVRQVADPDEIAAVLGQVGCRYERRDVRPGLAADADQDVVLAAYRDVIDEIVAKEGFVAVDVAGTHPSDDPGWAQEAKALRGTFINEHTHGEDEVRFMVRGSGVFFLHIAGKVHAVHAVAGDLLGVPQGTTHWFDMGPAPDLTTIRFFRNPQGWAGVPTGSDISQRFPDYDTVHARALGAT
jgi:1,2-dihydroxy-3-keto-5-methylthiopentene dioxygenase